jgi:hypothetical protein
MIAKTVVKDQRTKKQGIGNSEQGTEAAEA